MPALFSIILFVDILANACAVARFYWYGLYRVYNWFFMFLVAQFGQAFILFFLNIASPMYFWVYVCTQPVLWVLYILIVRELYSLIFKNYQGIYTLGRWAMYAAWTISIGVSALSLIATSRSRPRVASNLYYIETTERGVVFSLILFIPLVLFLLSRYPINLHRNIVVHCALYSLLFLAEATQLLMNSLSPHGSSRAANLLIAGISAACYFGWAVLLTREGEYRDVVVHPRSNPAEEDRLLQQLNAMNQTLLQVIRK
ncbi:MAG: hypothetical protein ACR2I2_11825 [Bryobacteraceae bacterium]